MKNAMQLKAIIKKIANDKNISAQLVMQNFMLERLLERIATSKYRDNFILKGGFLIAAMVGIDSRATMDMDTTIKDIPVSEEVIINLFEEILKLELNDDVSFLFQGIEEIRESSDYSGYRVSMIAKFEPMAVPLKLDITTGDKLTPMEIEYKFKLLLEDREISVLAYNLETVMAEKLETIISRGDLNTRPRDYYDIYILYKLQSSNIELKNLKLALLETCKNRGTNDSLKQYKSILEDVKHSKIMQSHWTRYQKDFEYAKDISFVECLDTVDEILKSIDEH